MRFFATLAINQTWTLKAKLDLNNILRVGWTLKSGLILAITVKSLVCLFFLLACLVCLWLACHSALSNSCCGQKGSNKRNPEIVLLPRNMNIR